MMHGGGELQSLVASLPTSVVCQKNATVNGDQQCYKQMKP